MSRGQRLALIALAVVIAAVAFVLARPDDDEEKAAGPARSTETTPSATPREPTATTDTRPEQRLVLRGHKPVGGVARIEVKKGELVRMVIESDASDQIHVHGYDIEREAAPRAPARFSFRADAEGVFEVESHEAEHGGGDPLIARLVVAPS
jgi:hypothetical protein